MTGSVVIALLLSVAAAGCLTDLDVERYVVEVDEIIAPGTVAPADTLHVRFTGIVGTNGCYRLDRVETRLTGTGAVFRFHGEHHAPAGANCPDIIVPLNHVAVLPPPRGTPFTVSVEQPDGSTLDRVVTW